MSVQGTERMWFWTARISGVFCITLMVLMAVSHFRVKAQDPWKSPRLLALKEQLRNSPKDDSIKQQIRALDLQLRTRYFNYMARMEIGVYALIGGAALLVMALVRSRTSNQLLPDLQNMAPDATQRNLAASVGRWAVLITGATVLGTFLLAGVTSTSALPRNAAELDKLLGPAGGSAAAEPVSDAATPQEYRRNWPRFLGPEASGFAATTNAPEKWDPVSGKGVRWKTPVEVDGFNSPIVWENRVFFSGGNTEKREVVCLDVATGKTLWREALKDVPGSPAQLPEIPESTGFAAPTMATDGRRVYVIFANGDLGAFTLEGKRLWAKYVGPLKNAYGHANSLATWRDRLLVQLDQGDSEEGKSRLVAFDGRSGEVVWQKQRRVGASWASPIVFEAANKAQVALLSLPWVTAYSAQDGAELWKADCLNGEVTPSPIFAGGLLIVPSPSEKLTAFRPDGTGDVSKTHVAWVNEDSVPDVTSPASNGELVLALTTSGILTASDNKDGKKVWEKDYETEFHASPAITQNRIYLFDQKGLAIVAEAGREYKELLRVQMPDAFHASPAFAQEHIILRGVTNVWCLSR